MKPHLCLFTDSLEPSGVGQQMLSLAEELLDRYHVSLVCSPTEKCVPLISRARKMGLDVLELEVRGERAAWELLRDWLHRNKVEIFHCHAGVGWEGHHGVYAAHAAGVPVLLRTEHLPDVITAEWQHEEYMQLVQTVDGIICVSEEACRTYVRGGVPSGKLHLVRNGIKPPEPPANRVEVRRRLGLAPDSRIVLTVGRLTKQKGHEYLIKAIPEVHKRLPDTKFIMVGEGDLGGQVRAQISEAALDDNVHLIGRCEYVPDLMAAADLFVLPSLFEGLPLVVLEAMSAGLPVVGTRVCGTSEAVRDGVTGRLVEARDGLALAGGILEVLEDSKLAASWGAAGRQRMMREFTASRMALETIQVYEELRTRAGLNRPVESPIVIPPRRAGDVTGKRS